MGRRTLECDCLACYSSQRGLRQKEKKKVAFSALIYYKICCPSAGGHLLTLKYSHTPLIGATPRWHHHSGLPDPVLWETKQQKVENIHTKEQLGPDSCTNIGESIVERDHCYMQRYCDQSQPTKVLFRWTEVILVPTNSSKYATLILN